MGAIVKRGAFSRWWIHNADNLALGWSGSKWVPCDPDYGIPTGLYQTCNFDTEDDALKYVRENINPLKN